MIYWGVVIGYLGVSEWGSGRRGGPVVAPLRGVFEAGGGIGRGRGVPVQARWGGVRIGGGARTQA